MRASFITSEIVIGLRRNLTMTIAVILTTSVSLFMVGMALLMSRQVGLMKGYWYDKIEVSVFMCTQTIKTPNCNGSDVSPDQRRQLGNDLAALPNVKAVSYESKAEAYKHFKEQFKDSPDIVNSLTPETMPESYRVKLKDPNRADEVISAVQGQPGVDAITDVRKSLGPFFKFLNGMRSSIFFAAGVILVACVLLIYNTIRVAAFSRRRETGIMRLVGASNLYIRLPFLVEGALAGAVGASLGTALLVLGKVTLINRVLRPNIKFTPFVGWNDIAIVAPWLFIIGIVLSAASSFVAIQRHLRV